MLNIFKKSKNKKISEANKEYYKKHGQSRKVPVKVGNKVVSHIHLQKRQNGLRFVGENA